MDTTDDIVAHMRTKPSEELIGIYTRNDRIEWSDAAFEAIRQVLAERGVPLPQQLPRIVAQGKFRKARVKPMEGYGHYRGQGFIEVYEDGLQICGRHVHSLGFRWGWGLAIFVGMLVITVGAFAPGFIPLYLIMEYVWLKREETFVPFSGISSYAADSKRDLIAIDFLGDPWCCPAVLRTQNWKDLLDVLRQKVPDRDASGTIMPPASKARACVLSCLVFLGWYVLFTFLCTLALVPILVSQGIDRIPGIGNVVLRWLAWFVAFGLPLVLSVLLTIRYYRRKRSARALDGACLPPGGAT
jgi:hypothetical protein